MIWHMLDEINAVWNRESEWVGAVLYCLVVAAIGVGILLAYGCYPR